MIHILITISKMNMPACADKTASIKIFNNIVLMFHFYSFKSHHPPYITQVHKPSTSNFLGPDMVSYTGSSVL